MTGSAPLALFDLDNTLFDRARAFRAWCEEFVSARDLDRVLVDWLIGIDEDGLATRDAVFRAARERLGLSESVAELEEDYRRAYPAHFRPDPDLLDELRELRKTGCRIGIVTNGPASQLDKIRGLGLDAVVDAWGISDLVGAEKPSLAIFEAVSAAIGAPLSGYMVGDQTETDILGGHRAGLRTILLARGRTLPLGATRPDEVAADIHEAIALIVRDLAGGGPAARAGERSPR